MSASRRLNENGKEETQGRSMRRRSPSTFSSTFRLIPKQAPEADAILIVGLNGKILDANAHAAEIFAPDCKNLSGMPFASPEDLLRRTEIEIVRGQRICRAEMVVTETTWNGEPAFKVILVDITRLWNLVEELALCATRDPLTKLLNRAAIMEKIATKRRPEAPVVEPFALGYIDLNDFKAVNDNYGHLTGDSVLAEASRRLQSVMEARDTLARIGGDEFLMLLEGPNIRKRAHSLPDMVRDAFRAPFDLDGRLLTLGASCGASVYPDDGQDGEELIAAADLRMYRVKGGGVAKGSLAFPATPEELARDILAGQLRIRCQPQVFFHEKEDIAAEARCYWEHPRLGLVRAGSFLGVAEKSDLIVAVDEFVLHHSCRLIRAWQDQGAPIKRLALNVSAASLNRQGWVELVANTLVEAGVHPGFLELEIPDSLELTDGVCSVLQDLRSHGVRVAVDSFGSGPQSLQWVRQLPVDTLKIDRSLVAGFLERPTNRVMVEAFIQMGRSLGFTVIAEGVEQDREIVALQALGCDAVQGFAISDALPDNELLRFANAYRSRSESAGGLRLA
jgi:diguanylate cyclase (GGDEF)-like protein